MANLKQSTFFKIIFVLFLVNTSKAAAVDRPLKLCSISDDECFNSLYQDLLLHVSEHGASDIGMPTVDPLEIKNISFNFLDSITITITEGTIEGLSKCKYEKTHYDIEKMHTEQIITCDMVLKNKFVVKGKNDFLKNLFGTETVEGKGDMTAILEKLRLDMILSFKVDKRGDKTYLNYLEKDPEFEYTLKNATIETKNVIIAGNDMSKFLNEFFNSNWISMLPMFGRTIVAKYLNIFLEIGHIFFSAHPTEQFIKEDLTAYVSKN